MSAEELIAAIYGDWSSVGPLDAQVVIHQMIWRLRRKLPLPIANRRRFGWQIEPEFIDKFHEILIENIDVPCVIPNRWKKSA